MAPRATSNREAGLKAEVPFDITYKVEWRSDLDFVRCTGLIHSLSFSQSYLFTVTQRQTVESLLRGRHHQTKKVNVAGHINTKDMAEYLKTEFMKMSPNKTEQDADAITEVWMKLCSQEGFR